MKCLFYSFCNEPRYLCCNFCSDLKCEKRCKDDHNKCKFYEKSEPEINPDKPNHVINSSDKLYRIVNKKEDLILYKKYGVYIEVKASDIVNLSDKYIEVQTTKNRALKKIEELNKIKPGWELQ